MFRVIGSYLHDSHASTFFSDNIIKSSMEDQTRHSIFVFFVTLTPSSETQGQLKGARESLNGRKNIYGTKKSKERREEPLGTMSYQTSSKRSPPFWLLIGARKTSQKPERRRPFGTGLVRHCPQGLFSPFFTFLRSIYIFPPV